MKKILLSILALVAVVSLSAKEVASPEAKASVASEVVSTVKLSGVIFDKTTNESLAGAVVTVNGQKIYSDLDGKFEIKNTNGSKLQLKVSMISYEDKIIELENSNETLKIEMNQR